SQQFQYLRRFVSHDIKAAVLMLRSLLSCICFVVLGAFALAQTPTTQTTGHLDAKIVVVDDLTPKPVALTDFDIKGPSFDQVFRPDVDGAIHADLAPGSYTLSNVNPLTFKEKSFKWTKTFDVAAGQTVNLTLTQEDAAAVEKPATREISD